MKIFAFGQLSAFLICTLPLSAQATDSSQEWSNQQLDEYSAKQQLINPSAKSPAQKVRELYPGKPSYSLSEIKTALNPAKYPTPFNLLEDHKQTNPKPDGSFSKKEALTQLNMYKQASGSSADFAWALTQFFGEQDWYKPTQIAYVESNADKALPKDPTEAKKAKQKAEKDKQAADAATTANTDAQVDRKIYYRAHPWEHFESGFHWPLVRSSWRDVLTDEDFSLGPNSKPPATQKDVVGAKLSYAHDAQTDNDTWSVMGAVILPWKVDFSPGGLTPTRIAVAPSYSINRVDNSGTSKGNVDSVLYRVGVYSDWIWPNYNALEIRAAGVYASDTGGNAELPGFEVDVEPRFNNKEVPLGYKRVLIYNPLWDNTLPGPTDPSAPQINPSLCDVSLRAWLHIEGGDVQDNGTTWDSTKGHFLRMGPTVQFQLNFPQNRLIGGKDFSLNLLYSYLPALEGSAAHESYVQISGVLDLYNDALNNRKVSITAQYQYGGLNFTKENLNLFTIGLGVKY
jgi:hypothetical protein